MNQLLEWLSRLFSSWKFWIVVPPWDIGVRVRLGKVAASLSPGPHLRIPMLDEIVLINTRLRITSAPSITMPGTRSGMARVVAATAGFFVSDPVVAMSKYAYPDGAVAAYLATEAARCQTVERCQEAMIKAFDDGGIKIAFVRYTEDVEVKTLRLLQGGGGVFMGSGGEVPGPNNTSRF